MRLLVGSKEKRYYRLPQTSLNRWTSSNSYRASWGERSKALLDLFSGAYPNATSASFSEYGCGPNQPFYQAVRSKFSCVCYDIKSWNDDCQVVNLNDLSFDVEKTDVAVLSGVLEYMDKPELTVARLSQFHRYMLLSYHPVRNFHFTNRSVICEIKERAESNGWRNHLNVERLIKAISESGYPVAVKQSRRQLLTLVEFHS